MFVPQFIHMTPQLFEVWNRRLGWISFAIALCIYGLTIEPTGSFWDAGEYISTSAKLQVGHPPGAPLLQMIGAFFALFAIDAQHVALMVNAVSAFSSAFTILFMFWTITRLGLLLNPQTTWTSRKYIALLGSGLVGALGFATTDSFWFNATETEVYAMASLIMALLLWLGLKWVDEIDSPRGNRWLVLIWFIIGLTFGIQFMGFLAIPSIGLLYYFKRYPTTTIKNFALANAASVATLLLVYKFSLTYVLKAFGWAEVFFVNEFGLPFNGGSLLLGLLISLGFVWALRYTSRKSLRSAHTAVLCALFLLLGFSTWLMLPIRANAQVVVNENDPSDARSLLAYYNREQYPGVDSPFFGAYYTNLFSSDGVDKDDKPKYEKNYTTGKYEIVNAYKNAGRGADPKHTGFLPRMWSEQNAENYITYYGAPVFTAKPEYAGNKDLQTAIAEVRKNVSSGAYGASELISILKELGPYIDIQPPSLSDNLTYMVDFQFNYMFWRYLMWNFVGKQDDVQGRYDNHGNWLSGINWIDSYRLGTQENLPEDIAQNKGRNTYYFLPFLLALMGIAYQFKKDKKQFWVLMVFFLFTGLAIQFYTNPPIFQPRERDYSLVGAFYVFAIWMGLGVMGLYEALAKIKDHRLTAPLTVGLGLLAAPILMGVQNWDDHDRSNRYTARSTAEAYLKSTQENSGALIFTIGDNDTFPLWYLQEIEGYRTDVRVICTSLLATDWYIDQMKRKAYLSEPIPSQLNHNQYRFGTLDAVYYQEITDNRWTIQDWMAWIGSGKPQTKFKYILENKGADLSQYPESSLNIVYYPTHKIRIPVNKKNVLESGLVALKDSALIVDYIDIDLPKSALPKNRILMLDILANNDWKRPIYFSGGSFDPAEYIWLQDYLQLDGMAYKLVPIKTPKQNTYEFGRIDTDTMYDIVTSWTWGNSDDLNLYIDGQTKVQGLSFRTHLARLVNALIAEGANEKAIGICDIAMKYVPLQQFGFYAFVEPFIEGYYQAGALEKGDKLYRDLIAQYQDHLDYYGQLPIKEQSRMIQDIVGDLDSYRTAFELWAAFHPEDQWAEESATFSSYIERFSHFYSQDETPVDLENRPTDALGQ